MKFELPRGMRDIEPEEYRTIEMVKQKFLETSELFGFRFMEPSPIEMLSTLQAKSGASIGNEIYSFKDKGGRDVALRFDLTIGLTRYVVARRDLRIPVKLSSFGGMWRYDEPQMGRYRWFHQWDTEIYDSFNTESDAEIIEFTKTYLDMIGLKDTVIDICDRELLEDYLRNSLDIQEHIVLMEMLRAVDKVPKKGDKAVMEEYSAKGFDAQKLRKLIELSTVKGRIDKVLSDDRVKNLGKVSKLTSLMNSLETRGVKNARINMGIVRGLDYYSGIVFEVFDRSAGGGALVGGGRYDALTAVLGRSDIGATGAAGGIERIVYALSNQPKSAEIPRRRHKVYVAYTHEDLKSEAVALASILRANGIPAEFDLVGRSLKKQLEEAAKNACTSTFIFAPEELKDKKVIWKDMVGGKEDHVGKDELFKDPWKMLDIKNAKP